MFWLCGKTLTGVYKIQVFMPYSFSDSLVPVFPGINDIPVIPTDSKAGNGSDLVARHNLLTTSSEQSANEVLDLLLATRSELENLYATINQLCGELVNLNGSTEILGGQLSAVMSDRVNTLIRIGALEQPIRISSQWTVINQKTNYTAKQGEQILLAPTFTCGVEGYVLNFPDSLEQYGAITVMNLSKNCNIKIVFTDAAGTNKFNGIAATHVFLDATVTQSVTFLRKDNAGGGWISGDSNLIRIP